MSIFKGAGVAIVTPMKENDEKRQQTITNKSLIINILNNVSLDC